MDNIDQNNIEYINDSKINIDTFLYKRDYRKAFGLLILVLENLDEDDKIIFLDYYSKKIIEIGIVDKN
jgi:hypothetical protein